MPNKAVDEHDVIRALVQLNKTKAVREPLKVTGNSSGTSDHTDTGMKNPMTDSGSIIIGGLDGAPKELKKASDGLYLKLVSGKPAWAAAGGGGGGAAIAVHEGATLKTSADLVDLIFDATNFTITEPSPGHINVALDTISITSASVTDFVEAAQDAALGSLVLIDSTSIDFGYNDGANTATADVKYAGSNTFPLGTAATAARSDHSHAYQSALTWTIDEGGVPALNTKGWIMVPFAHTVKRWYLLANAAGDIQIDIWRDSYSNFPPTIADSVPGAGTKPALSGATKGSSSTLTSWSTTGALDDIYTINVVSAATLSQVTFILIVERTT